MLDWIELTSFEFETVVGILDWERTRTQPMAIELSLGLSLEAAGRTGALDASVDYASVKTQLMFLAREGRWRLIESLALAACRLLLAPPGVGEARAQIEVVSIRITKPKVLAPIAVPGVRVRREQSWFAVPSEKVAPGVEHQVLLETPVSTAIRIQMAPGAEWQTPPHMAVLVIAGSVVAGTERLSAGENGAPTESGVSLSAVEQPTTLLLCRATG